MTVNIVPLIICLVVVGVLLYLVHMIPMDAKIRTIIDVVVLLAVCLWLLQVFGIVGGVHVR